DYGEVSGREIDEPAHADAQLRRKLRKPFASRMAAQELEGLAGAEEAELRLYVESPERRLVDPVHEVGRSDEDAGEGFQLCQHLIDLGHLPAAMGAPPILQETVDLI